MKFLSAYFRNLVLLGIVVGGTIYVTMRFYPWVLQPFRAIAHAYGAFYLWLIVILLVMVFAIPWKRKG